MNDTLIELLQICSSKNFEFHFKMSDEKLNIFNLDYENKIMNVTIGDLESPDLPTVIEDIISQLK